MREVVEICVTRDCEGPPIAREIWFIVTRFMQQKHETGTTMSLRCGLLAALMLLTSGASALDNGLALTPPMGWLTWERFRCITDCEAYPDECISENLIRRTADLMVSEGYLEAGYEYLGIDDCWLEKKRGPDNRLVPDKKRFPNGMKAIADYIHARNLKFGLYEDFGNYTCAGYPGVLGYEQLDVTTFAEWEVDYIKLDGCNVDRYRMDEGYPDVGKMLNATGRPILYSCSWPAYQEDHMLRSHQRDAGFLLKDSISDSVREGRWRGSGSSELLFTGQNTTAKAITSLLYSPNYKSIAKHCNMWRNWNDIEDSWSSLLGVMDWFGNNQERIATFAGPGHWNDPDMLLIGNYGLTVDQAKVQMAVWAILAAPLLISADLATMRPEFKEILLNHRVIAINQDRLGKQGLRVFQKKDAGERKGLEVWTRELSDGSYAVAFVSRRDDGAGYAAKFTFEEMQLPSDDYLVEDLFDEVPERKLNSDDEFPVRINPSGVKFYKFYKLKQNDNKSPPQADIVD
ncbi:Alpha-N-acetylgalactosaminidase [Eumeta japonica]|uniref:Alpha-galactosidase n=1 Tax=Eumeta variegata TaxID=151549 RepID=A0A4C1TUN6_EUMVA|nr:Alpha-N-acetylgalactosaminidase [Eumeta japonica]